MFRNILKYVGLTAAALSVLAMGAGIAYLVAVTSDLPSVESLKNYTPPITTRVYAGNGTVLGEYARERPEVVALTCFAVGFVLGWKLKPW